MIVYKRPLVKKDFDDFNDNGIMYIKTDNVGYIITKREDTGFFIREKKIFNNQLNFERKVKTIDQVIKIVN